MPFNSEIIPDATRPQTRSKNHIYFPPIHPFNTAIPYEEIYGISTEFLHLLNDWYCRHIGGKLMAKKKTTV